MYNKKLFDLFRIIFKTINNTSAASVETMSFVEELATICKHKTKSASNIVKFNDFVKFNISTYVCYHKCISIIFFKCDMYLDTNYYSSNKVPITSE